MTTTATPTSLDSLDMEQLRAVILSGLDYSIYDLIKMELEHQCSEMDGVDYANLRDEVIDYVATHLLVRWN